MNANHQERAAAMLEEMEAIERQHKDEERAAQREAERKAEQARLSARWAKHRAAAHAALSARIGDGTELRRLADELKLKVEVRETAASVELHVDGMAYMMPRVCFEDRPIYSSRYSFRSSGTKPVALVYANNTKRQTTFPLKSGGTFSYDKIAEAIVNAATVLLSRLLHEQRAAATRAGHAPAYRELMERYGMKSKYGSDVIAHNEWYNASASAVLGRLDVELALQPNDAQPFVVKLPSGIALNATQAAELLDLLSKFQPKTSKE